MNRIYKIGPEGPWGLLSSSSILIILFILSGLCASRFGQNEQNLQNDFGVSRVCLDFWEAKLLLKFQMLCTEIQKQTFI